MSKQTLSWLIAGLITALVHLAVALVPLHISASESPVNETVELLLTPPAPPEPLPNPEQQPLTRPETEVEAPAPQPVVAKPKPTRKRVVARKRSRPAVQAAVVATPPAPVAVVETAAEVQPQPQPDVAVAPLDMQAYGRSVRASVLRQRRYPRLARRMELEGTVEVEVRVRRDGALWAAPRVIDSSGFEVLDGEALRMVAAAAPFVPPAGSFADAYGSFRIPIQFVLDDE